MTSPNFGLAQGGGFQNALAQGLQFGQMTRQRQEEKEYKNALAQYAASPSEAGLEPLAQHAPEFVIQERGRLQQQQQQAQMQDLTRRAIGGDTAALDELAVQNLPAWKALSDEQRTAAAQETKIFGQAALDILNRPPEQRMAAVQAYVQQLGQQYPEVAQIAQLPPEQLEMALRAAVAEAQMVDKLHAQERPDYMAIPAGGTLVDTRNPQAVQQFGQGPQPGMVEDGYRFKGGNPADPNAWEPVAAGGAGPGQQGFQP